MACSAWSLGATASRRPLARPRGGFPTGKGDLDQCRARRVAPGEVQQRREKCHARKRLGDEVRTGLGDGTEIRIPSAARVGHAHNVREEDQLHSALDQVQDGAVGDLDRKAKSRAWPSALRPDRPRRGPRPSQVAAKKVEYERIERMGRQGPGDADASAVCRGGATRGERRSERCVARPDRRRRRRRFALPDGFRTGCTGRRKGTVGRPPRNGRSCSSSRRRRR